MRATTLIVLAAGASALQPTLRVHAAAQSRTSIVARAEPEREEGMVDIRPQPRELDSDAELGLTVLAPGIALFALIAVVAQFAHPV
mmetsp:Transcript_23200/g.60397  ORF Transcript_23200/g.60397 Transcript_23200/m.60397 type:complete len:86 (-) Transcript_23200:39-296(-)